MATRNLTSKFTQLRSTLSRNNSTRSGSLSPAHTGNSDLLSNAASTTNWTDARTQLPPLWVDLVDQVEDDVRQIASSMDRLKTLHGERVNAVFEDTTGRDREIEGLSNGITGKFRHAESTLKKIGKAAEPGQELSQSEVKVRMNIQSSMARKIQEMSVRFRQQQKEYLSDVSGQKSGNDMQFGIDTTQSTNGDRGFNQQQLAVVDNLEGIVSERDEEIQNIAKSIEELSSIFKELAVLVIDQGTILDRIDFNMEQVVEHTKEGIQQLEKAEEHQKSARPLKCIFCLLTLIAIMMTILVLKHR